MRPLLLLIVSAPSWGQEWIARTLPVNGDAPSPRVDGAIAYDGRTRQVFLFGGRDTSLRNDLWVYSAERGQWRELRPQGTQPPARLGHTLVLDEVRRRVILFGGQAAGFFNDTWAYEIDRNTWQQLAAGNPGPSRRYGHSAIYDAQRDRMVISHGFTDAGRFDDTWAFDFASARWRDISPSSGRPLRRCLHHAVYDRQGDQMLLYGGCASGAGPCPLGDLWSFDLDTNRWIERTGSVKPPARQWYGMGFDSAQRRLVLFGGSGESGTLNDIWDYDPATNAWRGVALLDPAPAPRQRHEAAEAPELGGVLYFGGSTNTGLTNELLLMRPREAAGPSLSASGVVNAFSKRPGPVAPGQIVSLLGSGLGPDAGVSASWNSNGELPRALAGVTVLFQDIPSPIYSVQSGRIDVQAPYEIAGLRQVSIVVNTGAGSSSAVEVPVVDVNAGLHSSIFRLDGTVITEDNPAGAGEVVSLFATGYGQTVPAAATGRSSDAENPARPLANIAVRVGENEAEILFAGQAPATAGVLQINTRLPEGAGAGRQEVTVRVGGSEARAVLYLR
jgi:uncharacterized protein (TIGR03437 family)